MKKSAWVWIVIILIILGIWYMVSSKKEEPVVTTTLPSETSATSSPSGVEPNIVKPGSGVVPLISVSSNVALGKFLVGTNNMTVYTYSKDTKGVSNCTGTCTTTWVPYTTTAGTSLVAGAGATGDFSTIGRSDGGRQLTYNGKPLYYYKSDTVAGDTKGQNFNASWFVVKP